MSETGTTPPRHLEYLPLDELPGAETNPKRHDRQGIADSMSEFAFMDPLVLDERTGRLVSGHGRRDTLRWKHQQGHVPPEGVVVRDDGAWLAPVVRGWASRDDAHAAAAGIAVNRHTERGGWNDTELATVLRELEQTDPGMILAAGYSETDLDDLTAELEEQLDQLSPPADETTGAAGRDDADVFASDADSNVKQFRSIEEKRDLYALHDQRQIVLSYGGQRYVWLVMMLSDLAHKFEVETHSEAVLRAVEEITGENAPALGEG